MKRGDTTAPTRHTALRTQGTERIVERVGVDIGGTFTDLVGIRDGHIVISKRSTTPDDPTAGVTHTMEAADVEIAGLREFLHGTTIAINTVLERKGAVTALLTTEGFRDVYEIGRGNRPEGFNLDFRRPRPLIPRDRRIEVKERMSARGEELTALDPADVERVCGKLADMGVQSVAVCFLHAYANPAHERLAGEIIRSRLPDVFVTESHEILREYREYERTSTTALNAYIGPRVRDYLTRLEGYLEDASFRGSIQIMRSNGGTMSSAQARAEPVSMMESGPVAGMIAAGRLAHLLGIAQCVGFDMGGTTAKASLINDGVPEQRDGYYIGGYASGQPMQLPVVDIVEVGAGGGSIARTDEHGGLHVGPTSAGADPGPACYGRGGEDPVVTDADLLQGRLSAARFLGGAMALDRALAEEAMRRKVAGPLDLSVGDAAFGVTRIADAAMSLAIRAVSVERGYDPRDCVMIAFGGAGPLHAVALAREIHIPRVIVPKVPGNFSALGILLSNWRHDLVQTFVADLDAVDVAAASVAFGTLEEAAKTLLGREHIEVGNAVFSFAADLRYRGQEHSIPVPIGSARDFEGGGSDALRAAFDRLHERRYGHSAVDQPIQIANLRLSLTMPRGGALVEEWLAAPFVPEGPEPDQAREVTFDDPANPVRARVAWRPGLGPGETIEGPAVIEEPNSTTLVFPGDTARITEHGHIDITLAPLDGGTLPA